MGALRIRWVARRGNSKRWEVVGVTGLAHAISCVSCRRCTFPRFSPTSGSFGLQQRGGSVFHAISVANRHFRWGSDTFLIRGIQPRIAMDSLRSVLVPVSGIILVSYKRSHR